MKFPKVVVGMRNHYFALSCCTCAKVTNGMQGIQFSLCGHSFQDMIISNSSGGSLGCTAWLASETMNYLCMVYMHN